RPPNASLRQGRRRASPTVSPGFSSALVGTARARPRQLTATRLRHRGHTDSDVLRGRPPQESSMFAHNKRLQYSVRVSECNPGLAHLRRQQLGGPQGELAAALRHFAQALAEGGPGPRDMLPDIATGELSPLDVIGTIVPMLNRGAKGKLAEAIDEE